MPKLEGRILIPSSEIQKRVQELALAVHNEHQGDIESKRLMIVPIADGATRFGNDLVRGLYQLDSSVLQRSIQIGSYGMGQESNRNPQVLTHLREGEFEDKHILLLDDIAETRLTLQVAIRTLTQVARCASVTVMVLLAKKGTQEVEVPLDYVGFWIGKEWVWGYNIDSGGDGRGADDIMMKADTT